MFLIVLSYLIQGVSMDISGEIDEFFDTKYRTDQSVTKLEEINDRNCSSITIKTEESEISDNIDETNQNKCSDNNISNIKHEIKIEDRDSDASSGIIFEVYEETKYSPECRASKDSMTSKKFKCEICNYSTDY